MMRSIRSSRIFIRQLAQVTRHHCPETSWHIKRVRYFTQILASELLRMEMKGLTPEQACRTVELSHIHDIGKVCIPESILNRAGPLTDEQMERVRRHTEFGGYILDDLCLNMDVCTYQTAWNIVVYHHERFDGKGYPYALNGEDIPVCARIVALADVYDALSSPRCYKPAYTRSVCRDIIVSEAGGHFDPFIVRAFLNIEEAFWNIHQTIGFQGDPCAQDKPQASIQQEKGVLI